MPANQFACVSSRANMAYDHHDKTGNPGDCVKHPALIAALDTALAGHTEQRPFHYFDAFAGHAWHPLLDEGKVVGIQNALEWPAGIAQVQDRLWDGSPLNKHVELWRNFYLPKRQLVRGWYPGSSVIAADICRNHSRERSVRLTLFDISDAAQNDLRMFFQPVQPTEKTRMDWCVIGRRFDPAAERIGAICEPDFVFVDPPGFGDEADLVDWRPYFQYVLLPRAEQNKATVVWLPASGAEQDWGRLDALLDPPTTAPAMKNANPRFFKQLAECRWSGFWWSVVRWNDGGSKAACALIYNQARDVIVSAIDNITGIANWDSKHSNPSIRNPGNSE